MPMISSPPIGAIAYSKSGTGCPVVQVEGDRVTVLCSDGKLKRVPLSAIARWEPPKRNPYASDRWLFDPPKQVGDRVVIRNLTACLKHHPRLSLDSQCAEYRVVRVNDDGTVNVTSDYVDARYPVDWLGVLPAKTA